MKLNEHHIERIGVWVIRSILALGAVYCAATGNTNQAGGLGFVLIISFLWL